jgi:hypothetical protein
MIFFNVVEREEVRKTISLAARLSPTKTSKA